MKDLNYKGYQGVITEIDYDSGLIHGEVLLLKDVVTFKARDPKQLVKEFKISVDDYLAFCKEEGAQPNKPLKGEILVRCGTAIQQEVIKVVATKKSSGEKISQNDWCIEAIKEKLQREELSPLLTQKKTPKEKRIS